MSRAVGQTGTVEFDGQFVTITRDGMRAKAVFGGGEKRIPVRSVTAVQFKPAGALTQGFIQFTIVGGTEKTAGRGGRVQEAFTDENSVVFLKKTMSDFEVVRDEVNAAIAAGGGMPAEFATKKADVLSRM